MINFEVDKEFPSLATLLQAGMHESVAAYKLQGKLETLKQIHQVDGANTMFGAKSNVTAATSCSLRCSTCV